MFGSLVGCEKREPGRGDVVDPQKRLALIERVKAAGGLPDDGRGVLIHHGLFFDGNHDIGSIAWDAPKGRPGIYRVARTLAHIGKRPEVRDVLIRVTYLMESNPDGWPTGEEVVIVADTSIEQVRAWVAELHVVRVSQGWPCVPPPMNAPTEAGDTRVYTVSWK